MATVTQRRSAVPDGAVVLTSLNVNEAEAKLIERALEVSGGNRTKAAELLGISVRTLRNKLNGSKNAATTEEAANERQRLRARVMVSERGAGTWLPHPVFCRSTYSSPGAVTHEWRRGSRWTGPRRRRVVRTRSCRRRKRWRGAGTTPPAEPVLRVELG